MAAAARDFGTYATAISQAQLGAIHALAKKAGLDEVSRRDVIQSVTGKRSSRDLSAREAGAVIDRLKELTNASQDGSERASTAPAAGALPMDGRYAGKLRALWVSGWHLGVVRDRTDRALLAFVRRQTGISHPRWLDDADAVKAVEALKSWIAREADVDWPEHKKRGVPSSPLDLRRTVIAAQWRRLTALGAIDHHGFGTDLALGSFIGQVARGWPRRCNTLDDPTLTAEELDGVIVALGKKLRKALAERGGK